MKIKFRSRYEEKTDNWRTDALYDDDLFFTAEPDSATDGRRIFRAYLIQRHKQGKIRVATAWNMDSLEKKVQKYADEMEEAPMPNGWSPSLSLSKGAA